MRTVSWITAAAAAAALSGCVTYPVYQPPAPVSRLTPAQMAALDNRPLDAAERDRYAKTNADVQREDQADLEAQRQVVVPYSYAYPYSYGYYGYPAPLYGSYGGFYPWYPSLSLSFGYRGGWGGGYRGGYRGGYGGHHHGGGGHRR